jgi:DNA modification methylase
MKNYRQQNLFKMKTPQNNIEKSPEWGTFKDSLRAPVHRWFTYPAGFSYKAVEYSIKRFSIMSGQTIYDPFMGSGTTNIVAKSIGINSYGVEAHPFVYRIAKAKLCWDILQKDAYSFIKYVRNNLNNEVKKISNNGSFNINNFFPELVMKCYNEKTLIDLFIIRNFIQKYEMEERIREFFFVVLTALLRHISSAATGWPYIAPKKKKISSEAKDVLTEFCLLAYKMIDDLCTIKRVSTKNYNETKHLVINGDSRDTNEYIPTKSVDHVFTSPPYLNNFDYSDRTRLELYFWGEAKTWGDITNQIRTKLMTSATTQITRNDPKYKISDELKSNCPKVTDFLNTSVYKLSELRKIKGGKKSYDLMVSGYFNDMFRIIKDVYRVLKNDSKAIFVLGDSAPYGVHIPTDTLIGDIACGIGFKNYNIEVLRERGGKWSKNPQRHSVKLRESIVILNK